MPPRAKKTQVSVYLDPPIHGQLADYAEIGRAHV